MTGPKTLTQAASRSLISVAATVSALSSSGIVVRISARRRDVIDELVIDLVLFAKVVYRVARGEAGSTIVFQAETVAWRHRKFPPRPRPALVRRADYSRRWSGRR